MSISDKLRLTVAEVAIIVGGLFTVGGTYVAAKVELAEQAETIKSMNAQITDLKVMASEVKEIRESQIRLEETCKNIQKQLSGE